MSARDGLFRGWGVEDHVALCLTCKLKHLIPKGEQLTAQPWLDWLEKHPAPKHVTFVMPESELSKLDERLNQLGDNADVKLAYASSGTLTSTLTGLASDTNLLAGRASTAISNSSNYPEAILAGKNTTGTTPTATRQIEQHLYGSMNDTPDYPDGITGTDANKTITSADIKPQALTWFQTLPTNNTSDRAYPFAPRGICASFGGVAIPKNWGVFTVHNTGVNFNATATNHALYYTPVYQTVT